MQTKPVVTFSVVFQNAYGTSNFDAWQVAKVSELWDSCVTELQALGVEPMLCRTLVRDVASSGEMMRLEGMSSPLDVPLYKEDENLADTFKDHIRQFVAACLLKAGLKKPVTVIFGTQYDYDVIS